MNYAQNMYYCRKTHHHSKKAVRKGQDEMLIPGERYLSISLYLPATDLTRSDTSRHSAGNRVESAHKIIEKPGQSGEAHEMPGRHQYKGARTESGSRTITVTSRRSHQSSAVDPLAAGPR